MRRFLLFAPKKALPFECALFNPGRACRGVRMILSFYLHRVYLHLTRTRNHQIVNQRLDRSPGKRDVDDFSRHSTERAGELGE